MYIARVAVWGVGVV